MRMTQGRGKPVLAKLDEFPKILRPPAIVLEIYVANFSVVFQPNSTLRRVQPAKCRGCVLAYKICLSLRQTILKVNNLVLSCFRGGRLEQMLQAKDRVEKQSELLSVECICGLCAASKSAASSAASPCWPACFH